jgi:hypothetical protein
MSMVLALDMPTSVYYIPRMPINAKKIKSVQIMLSAVVNMFTIIVKDVRCAAVKICRREPQQDGRC